jgi:hypothetical protein
VKFEALYYQDRLKIVNPEGDVAITTLWSKVESAYQILEEAGVDLAPATSRIGPVANLYGNGLPQMLRNLLWNPQIRHIVILGKNLSGSREWLLNFFQHGLEEIEFLGAKAFRIRNTTRTIDGSVEPRIFAHTPEFTVLGDVGDAATKAGLKSFFETLPPAEPGDLARVEPPPIPEPAVTRFPTEPRSHTIVRETPMEAWSELIFRLFRFGHRNMVAKKSGPEGRVELQNIKGRFPAPDLTGHYRSGQSWGYFQVGGALRYIAYDDLLLTDPFDLSGHNWGWGISGSGAIKRGTSDTLHLQLVYGRGVENYFDDAPVDVAVEPNPGNAITPVKGEALRDLGLVAYLDHNWSSKYSSAIGYSRVNITNSDGQAANAYKNGDYISGNLLVTPAKNVMMGGEFQYAHRENNSDGFAVSDYRLQFSFKYSFGYKFGG